MRDKIRDIVKHTALGFIETVKVTGTDTETLVETFAENHTVVIKAHMHDPSSELRGVFGFNNLGLLRSLIEFPNYKTDDATVTVKYRERNGEKVPEEIVFKDEHGSKDHYRLMAQEAMADQPQFNGLVWDIEIAPTKSIIKEFGQRASMYSGIGTHFTVGVVDGDLIVYFGDQDGSTHKGSMVFEKGVTGTITSGKYYWPIAPFLQILKLSDGVDCIVSISNRGAFQITIESEIAEYRYIMPCIKRDN
jgi:hypothetical protein